MRRVNWLATWGLVFEFFCSAAAAQTADADRFAQLLDDAWQFEMREDPLWATHTGDMRYNDLLPSETLADQTRRLNAKREFLRRLQAVDRSRLPRAEQLNYDIFSRLLEDSIAEYEFQTYLTPITNRSGFHISFPELPRNVPLNDVQDYENYIARLGAFGRYASDHIELLRSGIENGHVLPAVVLEGYRTSIEAQVVEDATKSLLDGPFTKFPETIPQAEQQRLQHAGRQAILNSVVPGYRKLLEFMEQEYVPAARGSIGASALPGGREFYRHRVRMFTTLDTTPDEVHNLGLAEVQRIRGEMDAIIKKVGFEGDFAEFVEYLRSEPRFYATSPEQLLKEVSFVLKKMDGQLPRLFKSLPRTPYGIREIPPYIAPRTTSAYYNLPAGDGSRAGFYYVNTFDLKSRPLFEIEALSLHEAVPGHHLQLTLQQELADLPPFRRFAGFTAFVEGWALYAERLGLEVGFYEDPYSDFGRLSFEMWRACRLVVDTGMHYFGWTRQQAIDLMAANTALSRHNIEAEVDRYISWPGQALAYKTGELKIRQLRELAEQKLGPQFDIRDFHDAVLSSGSVPLNVLEENVNAYIESCSMDSGE
jgi:uncharacterized protein (DUF885 family)